MDKDRILQLHNKAKKLVIDIEDDFINFAYQVVLFSLISGNEFDISKGNDQVDIINDIKKPIDKLNKILSTPLDFSGYSNIIDNEGWAEKALVVLSVIEHELGIDSLKTSDFEKIFKGKIRLTSVYTSNISRALSSSSEFFITKKVGQYNEYLISRKGEKHLANLLTKYEKMDD